MEEFLAQFTRGNVLFSAFWDGLMIGLGRLVMLAFNKKPRKEWHYWATVGPLVFVITSWATYTIHPAPRSALVPTIEEMSVMKFGDAEKMGYPANLPGVAFIVSIKNNGTPTISEYYSLKVTFTDGSVRNGFAIYVPDRLEVIRPNGVREAVHHKDALDEKTLQPIPTGGLVRGRIVFAMPDVQAETLQSPGTRYELGLRDAWGRRYSIESTVTVSTGSPLPEYPGIERRRILTPPAVDASAASPKEAH